MIRFCVYRRGVADLCQDPRRMVSKPVSEDRTVAWMEYTGGVEGVRQFPGGVRACRDLEVSSHFKSIQLKL